MRSTDKLKGRHRRRGPAPKETLMWGLRGYVPREFWALVGALPGMTIRTRRPAEQRLTNEDYNAA